MVSASLVSLLVVSAEAGSARTQCCATCYGALATCAGACAPTALIPIAGIAMFAACEAACLAAEVACLAKCDGDHPYRCFEDDVMLTTFSEACNESNLDAMDDGCFSQHRVQDVRVGTQVVTQDATGKSRLTRVFANERIAGRVEGQRLAVVVDGDTQYLTVTSNHVVLATSAGHTDPHLVLAANVDVGDLMSYKGHVGTVSGNMKVELQHRNSLATVDGTVLANGLLVSTICEEYGSPVTTPNGGAFALLRQWQLNHSAVMV